MCHLCERCFFPREIYTHTRNLLFRNTLCKRVRRLFKAKFDDNWITSNPIRATTEALTEIVLNRMFQNKFECVKRALKNLILLNWNISWNTFSKTKNQMCTLKNTMWDMAEIHLFFFTGLANDFYLKSFLSLIAYVQRIMSYHRIICSAKILIAWRIKYFFLSSVVCN